MRIRPGARRRLGWWLLLAIAVAAVPGTAAEYKASPSSYQGRVARLKPGDTVDFAPGIYHGLTLKDLHGTPDAWIVIAGPPSGDPAVIAGSRCCNTIEIVNCSFVSIENFTVDSKGIEGAFGVSAKDGLNNHTHDIRIEGNHFIGQGGSQMTDAISTKTPTWGWIIRGNVIDGAGTGIYLGNSDGTMPFVAGLIENNLIEHTIGYNMEIKWQRRRPMLDGMPGGQSFTMIRHNVFIGPPAASSKMIRAEPNLLLGGFPETGAGSTDMYEVYGNLFVGNPQESLLQASGRVSIHDNIFVGGDERAIALQNHDLPLKLAHVYNNTIYTEGCGICFGSPATVEDAVAGNLIFAAVPLAGPMKHASQNLTDTVAHAAAYVAAPSFTGPMDFYPREGKCEGAAVDLTPFATETDSGADFNGAAKNAAKGAILFRGAYAGAGTNPGWELQPALKKSGPTAPPSVVTVAQAQTSPASPAARPTLEITPSGGKRGESASFLIVLRAPEKAGVAAVQWELSAGAGVSIDPADIVVGSAAAEAEKTLACSAMAGRAGEERGKRCLLAGGKKTIPDGPIAIVRYRIDRRARAGTIPVRLEKILAVSADLQTIDLGRVEGELNIQ